MSRKNLELDRNVDQTIAPEWIAWIAENLLLGATEIELRSELEQEGVTSSMVELAVGEIRSSPIFAVASKLSRRTSRAEMIVRLSRTRSRMLNVEARPALKAEVFHNCYRAANRPVLLPDFAKNWPAVKKWTFRWLVEHFGDEPITICDGRNSDPNYDLNTAQLTTETTVSLLVQRIQASGKTNDFYAVARNRNLQSGLATLWQDITPAPGFLTETIKTNSGALWIGPAGTITPLHHDTSDILLCQIRGRKVVTLIAPCETLVAEQANALYGPSIDTLVNDRRFANIKTHTITLGPGETLFMPAGWWHHVEALDPSITVALNAFPDNNLDWYHPGSC